MITTIVGFWWQAVREKRHRQWDLEDRDAERTRVQLALVTATDRVKAMALAAADDVKKTAQITAMALAEHTAIATAATNTKIDENTRLTQEVGKKADMAYEVGNNIAEKIRTIGLDRLANDLSSHEPES